MQQATIRGLSHLRRRQGRQAKRQGQRHTCTNHPRGPGTSAQTPDRKRRRGHSNRCTSRQVDRQGRHARRIHQLVPGRVREMLSKFWTKLARTPRNAMAHDILGRLHHAALQNAPPRGREFSRRSGTSAQKSFDQDDGQGARRGLPVILDGLPCTSRDRDREVAASARCGSSGQQGCGFSLRTPSCPVLSIRTRSPLPDRPSPACMPARTAEPEPVTTPRGSGP